MSNISNGPGIAPRRGEAWLPLHALGSVVVLAFVAGSSAILFVLLRLGGWNYYSTPARIRAYAAGHALLRPSGTAGHAFGIAGTLLILATFFYVLRKHVPALRRLGSTRHWLEAHIFCGVLGPILVTIHTALKFNGVISVAFWSMALVVLSGFIGRYLYVRVPKTIRGTELTLEEIESRAASLHEILLHEPLPPDIRRRLDAFEARAEARARAVPTAREFLVGDFRLAREIRDLRRGVDPHGAAKAPIREALDVAAERATLLRRIALLSRTRKLFSIWHVFHRPLVYVMLAIATVHVAVALYFGYTFPHR
jgi:hypothetical protein